MLENINSPADIKPLSVKELESLAGEVRSAILNRLSTIGGHVGPNLGIVEATIALHYVFNSPIDKFVFDVSHQTYTHKVLTGRLRGYTTEAGMKEIAGYTCPAESEHDMFEVGHTSTSVSLASGLAVARDAKGEHYNVVAIIGDGSLSGGEALEGLDFAGGEINSNFIIVVNDNDMSIAENHGGLYKNLRELRESKGTCACNLFRAMGLDYVYEDNGNDIEKLIACFQKVKDIDHPIVVHINTKKGCGYAPAETEKENWHWHMPFSIEKGEYPAGEEGESYEVLTREFLLKKMKNDPKVITITAAIPANLAFDEAKRKQAGKQFIDVGIAEEHAVAMASGIAKNGGKPVFSTHSSFFQRTFDQVLQDLCINQNPATILLTTASVFGMNDITHLGIFDIPMISNIPNLVYLAPTNCEEYFAMLDWSIEQTQYPVAVRMPCSSVIHTTRSVQTDYSDLNKYEIVQQGDTVAVIALGNFFRIGEQVVSKLKDAYGINATLINPRYITGTDDELLGNLQKNHSVVVTLEDGVLNGGFGEKIARFYGKTNMKVLNYGLKKEFLDRYNTAVVLRANRLTDKQIAEDVKAIL